MGKSLVLVVLALLALGASVPGGFVFDDPAIFSDPAITSPSGWWQVWLPSQTRPLTYFTFWLNFQVGGENPLGYHLVNLALHLIAVWLAFRVLSRLIPIQAAFLAAALFAVHPFQTEPVAYVFARGTVLMTVFCLLSLDAWTRGRHWIAVACFGVALLAKEECAAFPLFLGLLHLSMSRNSKERLPIAAMLGLSLAAGLRVIWATSVIQGAGSGFGAMVSPGAYLLAQGTVVWRYLRMLVLPWGFTIDPEITSAGWLGGLGWALLLAIIVIQWKRLANAREGFWFIGALLLLAPSSTIFPASDLAADRRLYLPLFGFAAAASLWLRRAPHWLGYGIILVLLVISIRQSLLWQSPAALWGEAVRLAPTKVRPRIQLARTMEPAQAIIELQQARSLAPDDPVVASELGRAYMVSNNPQQALGEFGRALALAPTDPRAINNRGVALLALRQTEAAQNDFSRALTLDPCLFDAYLNLRRTGVERQPPGDCKWTASERLALREQ